MKKYLSLIPNFAETTPMSIEIHSPEDMSVVFEFAKTHGLSIYTQSSGFRRQTSLSSMPVSNKEGYVFLSKNESDYAFNGF